MGLQKISALIMALVLFLVVLFENTPQRIPFTEDIAFTYAVVETMLAGDLALLGPPSHIGGRHLGGLYYYLVSLTYLIANSSIYYSILLTTLLHLLGFYFILNTFKYIIPNQKVNYLWIPICFLILNPAYLSILRTPWHAHALCG